jgi:hypothetical protein
MPSKRRARCKVVIFERWSGHLLDVMDVPECGGKASFGRCHTGCQRRRPSDAVGDTLLGKTCCCLPPKFFFLANKPLEGESLPPYSSTTS